MLLIWAQLCTLHYIQCPGTRKELSCGFKNDSKPVYRSEEEDEMFLAL